MPKKTTLPPTLQALQPSGIRKAKIKPDGSIVLVWVAEDTSDVEDSSLFAITSKGDQVYRSGEELEYAGYLTRRKASGEILKADYQPERLRIGEGAYYTPDFRIQHADKSIEFIEIKGGHIREASLVRIKAAALIHPYIFSMWQKLPKKHGGGWRLNWSNGNAKETT